MYPAHGISMGQGGAVLTDSDEIAEEVRCLRDWGRRCACPPGHDNTCGKRFTQPRSELGSLPDGWDDKYLYKRLGYNCAVSEMQAAVGLVQLDKLDGFVQRRRDTYNFYREQLASLGDVLQFPEIPRAGACPSPFGFLVTVRPDAPFTRDQLVARLEARRIQTRPLFAGNLLRHPCMRGVEHEVVGLPRGWSDLSADALPMTDALMNSAFWLGVYPGVTDEMRAWVVTSIREEVTTLTKEGRR
jgi:CDP-6-deoxy-D-xylo-4-hexulose-3-dehydrase